VDECEPQAETNACPTVHSSLVVRLLAADTHSISASSFSRSISFSITYMSVTLTADGAGDMAKHVAAAAAVERSEK